MMITYSDLVQTGIFHVCLKEKCSKCRRILVGNSTTHNPDGCKITLCVGSDVVTEHGLIVKISLPLK